MKFIRIVLFLALPFCLISCVTRQKIPNYLENLTDTTAIAEKVQFSEFRIQKNDLLSIQVYSASTKPQISDAIYNLPGQGGGSAEGTAGSSPTTVGYLVDINGNIEYPQIGLMRVEGLTKLQLADSIKRKINEKDSVLTNPSVIIRFQNLRVTVLGEVNKQGPISVPGERVTVLEAIGLAGGFTDFGMKNTVKVIREVDGKREAGFLDLSSKDVFESPYYNLMQNDMVVVDPSKKKQNKADQDIVFRQISLGLSIITAVALIYSIIQ